jgi:DNA-binding MarR family transcriptional regulator
MKLAKRGQLTFKQLAEKTGCAHSTLKVHIEALAKEGAIEEIGSIPRKQQQGSRQRGPRPRIWATPDYVPQTARRNAVELAIELAGCDELTYKRLASAHKSSMQTAYRTINRLEKEGRIVRLPRQGNQEIIWTLPKEQVG